MDLFQNIYELDAEGARLLLRELPLPFIEEVVEVGAEARQDDVGEYLGVALVEQLVGSIAALLLDFGWVHSDEVAPVFYSQH